MITYGSYMSPHDDIPKTAIIVGVSIIGISVLVALMIFPMVFTFGFAPQEGEGLIFKTLPFVFEHLPGSIIISVAFFTLLAFAALTSSVAQFEVIVANHIDLHKWSRPKATVVAFIGCLIIGLPTALSASSYALFPNWSAVFKHSFLETNYIIIDWALCIFALATSIFVGWVIPSRARSDGFRQGSSMGYLFMPWLLLVRWVVPTAILIVMLNQAKLVDVNTWF
jgi:NSS family neurotransmitter:Na+ symporter